MKKQLFLFVVIIFSFTLTVISNISINKIFSLPNEFYVSYEEIANLNKNKEFGKLVDIVLEHEEVTTGQNKINEGEIVFKLFGIIPIKKSNVKLLPEEDVFVGGTPIGLSMQVDGAVVVSNSIVMPKDSKVIKNQNIKNGDIIKEINNIPIHSADDIVSTLNLINSDKVNIKYQNNNQDIEKEVPLIKDSEGYYKIGLWVKDYFSGVGTLTFVKSKEEAYQFGALGHPITNGQNENIIPVSEGGIYTCSLVDIAKGQKNNPGELRCAFIEKNKKGYFNKNTNVGIFGNIEKTDELIDQNRTAKLGGRLSVKPGNAKIVSKVSGILEEFDIEIIKASYQTSSADKSIIFRVKDKRLIDLTGGIVQGMSGSPIIQDGKIVGAVTHVFVSDPTKGFGVYSDWMLEQLD